jgi:hypothetical protein
MQLKISNHGKAIRQNYNQSTKVWKRYYNAVHTEQENHRNNNRV